MDWCVIENVTKIALYKHQRKPSWFREECLRENHMLCMCVCDCMYCNEPVWLCIAQGWLKHARLQAQLAGLVVTTILKGEQWDKHYW